MKLKQEKYVKALGVIVGFIIILVSFCGCTSNQNANEMKTQLSGVWEGNVLMTSFGMRNSSISQISFIDNTVELILQNTEGSFTMNYTYVTNGNTLELTPVIDFSGGFPGQPPQNWSQPGNDTRRPPTNETWPTNGTRPPMNDTWPINDTNPGNWTRPENGTSNPGGRQQSMSISFTYSLNEEHTILYLNGAEFRKIS